MLLKDYFRFQEQSLLLHQKKQLLLYTPFRANIRQFAFCFQGPKVFNFLNIEIQNVGTLSLSKSKLRTLLLS